MSDRTKLILFIAAGALFSALTWTAIIAALVLIGGTKLLLAFGLLVFLTLAGIALWPVDA